MNHLTKMKSILVLAALLCLSLSAQAKYSAKDKQELLNRAPGLTSKGVQRRLMRANELMAQDNRKGAIEILSKMTDKSYRPFEKAKVWQTLAYAYAQTEKYKEAKKAFREAVKLNVLPYKPTLQSIFALAQLELMSENFKKAEEALSDWFSLTKEERPDAYVFAATIAYHKGDKKSALDSILKGLAIAKKPKENWLTFAVSLLYESDRFKEASEMLFKLVELNTGKKMYWTQLAGTLLNSDKPMTALAVLDLALKMNLLDKEGEFLNIISLYLSNGLPYQASILMKTALDKGVAKKNKKNLELYANSLIQAKEYSKAMAPLEEAAKLSDDGKLYALKARLHLEKEEFKKAISLFDQALSKGLKKKETGQVLVEKSVALIQSGQPQKALPVLNKAIKYEESKTMAANWLSYIQRL